ncbi:MAG: hypothetical protein IKT51_00755 [Phascolarctobacterium sp.]|nr:hypothetical protein [Phascolarctobacterium sp.]
MKFLKTIALSIMLFCASSSLAEAVEVGDTIVFVKPVNFGTITQQDYEAMRAFLEKDNKDALTRMILNNRIIDIKKDWVADVVDEGYYGKYYGYQIIMANGPYQNVKFYVSQITMNKTIVKK